MALTNLVLSTLVAILFLQSTQYRLFCFTNFSVGLWSFFYFLWQWQWGPTWSMATASLMQSSATLIPYFYAMSSLQMAHVSISHRNRWWLLNTLGLCLLMLGAWTPWMIRGYEPTSFGLWPMAGPLFAVYILYFFLNVGIGNWGMWKRYQRTKRWVDAGILGMFTLGFLGGATNFPLWYHVPIPPYGMLMVPIYCVFVTWAVLKYDMVDIALVVGRGVSWAIATALTGISFVVGMWGLEWAWGGRQVWMGVPLVIGLAMIFSRLRLFIQTDVEKKFFRGRYGFKAFSLSLLKHMEGVRSMAMLQAQIQQFLTNELEMGAVDWVISPEWHVDFLMKWVPNGPFEWNDEIRASLLACRSSRGVVLAGEGGEWLRQLGKLACIPFWLENHLVGVALVAPKVTHLGMTAEDQALLELIAQQGSLAVERIRQWAIQTEVALAHHFQGELLPQSLWIPRFQVAVTCRSLDEVGGDYYDVIQTNQGHWVFLGDVMGHGMGSAMVMVMLQSTIYTLVKSIHSVSPSDLLARVDQVLSHNISRLSEQKSVGVMALFTPDQRRFVVAGHHCNVYWYHHQRHEVTIIPVDQLASPMGMGEVGFGARDYSFEMASLDVLLLITDGVIDAFRDGVNMQDPFGENRMIEILIQHAHHNATEIKDALIETFNQFTNYRQHDDMTVMVIKAVES